MKRITLTICAAVILFAACNSDTKSEAATTKDTTMASADNMKKEEAWVPIDSAKSMQAMMEAATPGQPHKMLASSSGTWNSEVTVWMSPDAPPTTSKGTSTNRMVMDGRYQISEHKGNMMGMPFNGISTTGYDNVKKKFVSTWIDNWGTGIMQMEGPWDESSKSMTLTGQMEEASTHRMCDMKESFKIVDDNTQLMEMWGPDPKTGKPFKTMEIKFTRKK